MGAAEAEADPEAQRAAALLRAEQTPVDEETRGGQLFTVAGDPARGDPARGPRENSVGDELPDATPRILALVRRGYFEFRAIRHFEEMDVDGGRGRGRSQRGILAFPDHADRRTPSRDQGKHDTGPLFFHGCNSRRA